MQKLICLCAILATMLATSMTREASGLPEPGTKLETDGSGDPKDDSTLCCCCCGYCLWCGKDGGVEAKKVVESSVPVEWYSNRTAPQDETKYKCCCCCGVCMWCGKDATSHIELYSNHTMTK